MLFKRTAAFPICRHCVILTHMIVDEHGIRLDAVRQPLKKR
jgi:hypothetical protein